MASVRIQPIVEGHGEVEAVPALLRHIWYQLGNEGVIDVLEPIRQPRSKLVIDHELGKFVEFAARKLQQRKSADFQSLILLLLDADEDPPCELGPKLLSTARQARSDLDTVCVLANQE